LSALPGGRLAARRWRGLAGVLCALGAFLLLVALTSEVASWLGPATDLYSRWYGMRRLLLFGENPYGPAVTATLASHMPFLAHGVEPAVPRDALATAFGFLYPLPGVLFLAPLALLPYQAALTLWMVAVLILTPVAAWLAVDATAVRDTPTAGADPARLARRLSLPLGLLFVPTLANLVHGQLAPAVLFGIALAFWLTRRGTAQVGGRPLLAGAVFGAACAVKPHLVLLLAPCWLGYHLWRWRTAGAPESRAFFLGALGAVAGLCALATVLAPTWALDFLGAAGAYVSLTRVEYADVTNAVLPGGPALQRLLAPVLPAQPPILSWVAAGAVGAGLVAWAVAGWRAPDDPQARGLSRTLIATVLIVPPAWETNAVLLLLPLAILLGRAARARGPAPVLALCALSVLLSALDLPLYATQPWRNAPLMILAYVLLIGAFGVIAVSRLPRRSAPAPGAAVPFARG
jgi:hypothetical protein